MINNDIFRQICTIFNFDNEQARTIFALGLCDITTEQLISCLKEVDDTDYKALSDIELASFLNGLITDKRGAKDGGQRQAESVITNNLVFNKVKIAMALKADDVIAILELAELSLGKYELSAFFRNVNNKHYRDCSDDVLSAFLQGLKIKLQ